MRRGAIVPRPETVAAGGPALSELLAALPVGILVIDPDRRIPRVHAACEQLLNLTERVLAGQRLAALLALPGPDRARRDGYALSAFDVPLAPRRHARVRGSGRQDCRERYCPVRFILQVGLQLKK